MFCNACAIKSLSTHLLCADNPPPVALQDLLVQRSSDTLRALAELDAAELKRYRHNALMWQATPSPCCPSPP